MKFALHKITGWTRVHRLLVAWGSAGILAAIVVSVTLPSMLRRPGKPHIYAPSQTSPSLVSVGRSHIGSPKYWTLSSSGRFLAALSDTGTASLWDTRGRKTYEAKPGASDTVVPSPSGRWILAYSRLNSERTSIALLNPVTKQVVSLSVDGAVWCVDAASREAADCYAIGTNRGSLYVLRTQGNRWHRSVARMPGAVVSASLDASGERTAAGCWQKSVVGLLRTENDIIWQIDRDTQSLQNVRLLHGGQRLFVQSRPNNPMKSGEYGMLDESGQVLWMRRTCFAAAERFHPSSDGLFLAVAYVRPIKTKQKTVYERHCLILDANGDELTDKGSLFTNVRPILMTNSGYAIVHNGDRSIMSLGSNDLRTIAQLPSPILDARESADGSTIAVLTKDGLARTYRVVQ